MILVVAEKPLLVDAIADAIPGQKTVLGMSCVQKSNYILISAFGHLLGLKMPEDYDPDLHKWTLDTLPIYFPDWEEKPKELQKGQKGIPPIDRLEQIKELLCRDDCEYVIHAGDPDEEGQYLIDEILQWAEYTGPVKRLATGDTTKGALEKALGNLKDNALFVNNGLSAYARSVADLMVGINVTRYFSIKNQVLLPVGRVQTPTLGMVIRRDELIESFAKVSFFDVYAETNLSGNSITAKYVPLKDDMNLTDGRILSESYAQEKVAMLQNETLRNASVTKKQVLVDPPLPFDLTKLANYCSVNFGYDPQLVIDITQTLRDKYKAITYNRSECQYLTEEQYKESTATMSTVINNISYSPPGLDMTLKSKCFSDKDVGNSPHTAIIPQNIPLDIGQFTVQEKNVYLAVCKYYIAQFLPPEKKMITKFTAPTPDGASIVATATSVIEPGFLSIFRKPGDITSDGGDDDELQNESLANVAQGTYNADILSAYSKEKETKPPARYTKSSLQNDMTCIAKYVTDPQVKQLLLEKDKDNKADNGSIGTAATRPSIIDGLVEHGYLEQKGRNIISTQFARDFFKILPDQLKAPNLTASWWLTQQDIRSGKAGSKALTDSVNEMILEILHTEYPKLDAKYQKESSPNERPSLGACPCCGKPIVEGKSGFGCSGYKDGCKFVIWKNSKLPTFSGVTITAAEVKKWLSKEWTPETRQTPDGDKSYLVSQNAVTLSGLNKKDGTGTFSTMVILKYDPNGPYGADFEFLKDENKPSLGECPRCGKPIIEQSSCFSCLGHNDGCNFVIWKKSNNPALKKITFTAKDITTFLSGKSVHKTNLVSKAGKLFEADLIMKDDINSKYGPSFNFHFEDKKRG